MFKKYLIGALLMLSATTVKAQDSKIEDFIRYKEGDGLQVAVTSYVSSSNTVVLVGAVHVGDKEYYKKVQAELDTYDAVLYEGVKQGTKVNPETKVLNTIQHLMGDVLGLQFQKDGIDYTRKNLIHADITIDELDEKLDGESIVPFGQYIKSEHFDYLKPILDTVGPVLKQCIPEEVRNRLKAQLARSLSQADVSKQLSPQMFKAIVEDRNKIVIDTLQKTVKDSPEKKNIAVFYGCAHNLDLQRRLIKLGYIEKFKRWFTAWRIEEDGQLSIPEEEQTRPQQNRMDEKDFKGK